MMTLVALISVCVAVGHPAQIDLQSGQSLPPFVIRNPSINIRQVANDGQNVIMGAKGYRFDRRYLLVQNGLDNIIFPTTVRDGTVSKLTVAGVEASLENDVALASLVDKATYRIGVREPAKIWAVYPIDRLADPRPTDLLHIRSEGYLVSAALNHRLLKATFAESISKTRVAIVDYAFQLAPRSSEGVFDAKLLKRKVWQRGFDKRLTESGRYVWNAVAIGDVSSDRSKIIRGNMVQSLVDGKITEHDTGRFATNVDFFFIGNDLYRTFTGASTYFWRTDPTINPFAGTSKYENGKWVRVSEMCLEAISANGKYAALKDVPNNAEEIAKRYVIRFKS